LAESETILETPRLILRCWARADEAALYEILRDPDVVRYIADGRPFSLEKVRDFLRWAEQYQRENGFSRWKVLEKSSGAIVGSCGFARPHETPEIELGYLFAKKFWGRGYASESAGAAVRYGFENLNFREIIAMTDLEHAASQRVLEKLGFTKRGVEIYANVATVIYLATKPENIL
jgi:[ribosomal protein S5]-alanine N-acetyltransferase